MARTVVVTGAARGLGLESCRQLLDAGDTVLACPRGSDAPELTRLADQAQGRLHVLPTDVSNDESVRAVAGQASRLVDAVDVLINNAGVYPKDSGVGNLDFDALRLAFDVNSLGPLRMTAAFLPLLRKGAGKRLLQMTSLMGSIADSSGGSYAYRMSKAALNMATSNLAHELGHEGFIAVAIHPGWVQTRMGGAGAPLDLTAATSEVLRIGLSAGTAENGAFLGPGGNRLPY